MLEINYNTKLLGVVGENIPYTLSPAIHNFSFQRLGINAVYLAFDIKRDKFCQTFPGLLNIAYGLNITIPYKEESMKYVEVTEEAKEIKAINTIYNGKGYNTDYLAVLNLIREKVDRIDSCTVFGAGGAAKAAVFAVLKLGCRVDIINRSRERAERLVKEFSNLGSISITSSCKEADVLINTTPDPNFIPDECVNKTKKLVVEFVYKPVKTSLISRAEMNGLKIINGLEILVRQAIEAEKIWFGKSLDDIEVVNYLYARKLVW